MGGYPGTTKWKGFENGRVCDEQSWIYNDDGPTLVAGMDGFIVIAVGNGGGGRTRQWRHDSLSGDRFGRDSIWCRRGHAEGLFDQDSGGRQCGPAHAS